MCETKVILREGNKENEIMKEAAMIKLKGKDILIYDILGNSKIG